MTDKLFRTITLANQILWNKAEYDKGTKKKKYWYHDSISVLVILIVLKHKEMRLK